MAQISSGSLTIVDVADSVSGINTATLYLYQRAASAPARPSSDLTYNFTTAELSGVLGSWTRNLGELTSTYPIWITAAVASSNGTTDVIAPGEWTTPTKMAEDGKAGVNQATVYIYQRATGTPSTPSSVTYTFANGNFTIPTNWSKQVPTSNGQPCWVSSAVAIGSGATAQLNWTTPSVLAEDGVDGKSPTVTPTTNGVIIHDPVNNVDYAITNGADGTQYYTHIRYSKNSNGAGYVTQPTSETKYIGVYSGTSSTAPAYNDTGWTWSLYVGADGESITISSIKYAKSTTDSQPADSSFGTSIPSVGEGEWLWTMTTYSDNSKVYTKSKQGKSGTSITVSKTEYQSGTSPTTAPTGTWSTSIPVVAEGNYLWTKTTYSDGNYSYTVAKQGQSGAPGTPVTITSTSVKYQVGTSATTAPTGTWQNSPQATTTGQYLWTRTIVTYSDGTSTTSYSVSAHGATGNSISISSIKYAISTTESQPTDSSFGTSIPTVNEGQWLWTMTTYSNGSKMYTKSKQGKSGVDGISVTGARELYYLKSGTGDAPKITATSQIKNGDVVNDWTSVVPTYVLNYRYYTCIETSLSSGGPVWSNPIENKALTTANYNAAVAKSVAEGVSEDALGALSIARGVRQFFFRFPTDVNANIPAGSYIAEEAEDIFKAGPTKGNLLTRSDGIWIRNGKNTLVSLISGGLSFFVPNGTLQGKLGMKLDASSLTFYNIDATNSKAATLSATGLVLNHGGIYGGSTSDLNKFVYISTDDFGSSITVNNHAATDWRLLINNKFGVDKAGNLYASNATIQGKITVGAGSNVYTTDSINPLDLGGRNILRGTEDITMTGSIWSKSGWYKSGTGTIETQVTLTDSPIPHITKGVKVTATTANTNCGPAQGGIPLRPGKIVLSAWVKGTAGDKVTIQTIWTNADSTRKETTGSKTYTIADSNWHRYSATSTVVYNHPVGTTTSAADNTFVNGGYVYFQSATINHTCLICGIKMEYGNEPTDWTPYEGSIVEVSGGGIRIADVMDLTNYLQINSTDISMWRNSNKMMSLGNSSLIFYDGTGTADTDKYAEFGSTIKIFNPTKGTAAVTINASGATFDGKIQATSGFIGQNAANGFTISNSAIYNPSTKSTLNSDTIDGIYLGTNGIALGKGLFKVTNTGSLTAKSGTIGGWNIGSSFLSTSTSGTPGSGIITLSKGIAGPTSATGILPASQTWAFTASNQFGVTTAGKLYATNATITGTLTAGSGSKIGPWFINDSSISRNSGGTAAGSYNTASNMYFGTSGISLGTAFKVSAAGVLTASGATIEGGITTSNIKATGGTIGGWTLDASRIYKYADSTGATVTSDKAKYYIYIQSSAGTNGGNYAFALRARTDAQVTANSPVIGSADVLFGVAWNGSMFAKNATIEGVIRAKSGYIGYGAQNKIAIGTDTTNASIYSGSHSTLNSTVDGFYIGVNGISLGAAFKVSNTGVLTASNITATGGKIGGFTLTTTQLYAYYANSSTATTAANGLNYILIQCNGSSPDNTFLKVQGRSSTSASWENRFYVTHGGYLWCNNAYIKGKIEATSGSFVGTVTATSFTAKSGNDVVATFGGEIVLGNTSAGKYNMLLEKVLTGASLKFRKSTTVKAGISWSDDERYSEFYCLGGEEIAMAYRNTSNVQQTYISCQKNRIDIDGNKNVYIVGTMWTDAIEVDGKATFYDVSTTTSSANARLGTNDPVGRLYRYSSSSQRYKHDIKNLDDKIIEASCLYNLDVKQFKYNKDYLTEEDIRFDKDIPGFIAEDVYDIYPIAADLDDNGNPEDWNVRYIVPPMLKLIQEQHEEIEQLKKEVTELKNK